MGSHSWSANKAGCETLIHSQFSIFSLCSLRQVGWEIWSSTKDQTIAWSCNKKRLRYCEPWLCSTAAEHLYKQQFCALSSPKLSPPHSSPPSPSWSSSPSTSRRACSTCLARRAPSSRTRADQPPCHHHHGRKPRDQDHPANNTNKIWTSCLITNQMRLMGVKENQRDQSSQTPGEVYPLSRASLCQLPPQMLFWTTLKRFLLTVPMSWMACSGKTFFLAGPYMIKR